MKKIIFKLALLASTSSMVFAQPIKNEMQELKIFKDFNVTVTDVREVSNGWFTIKGVQPTPQGKRPVNFYTDKNILIIGSGIDLKTGKLLDIQTDYSLIKNEAAFTIGDGKDEYFLVTDPECPYCKMLDKKLHLLKKDAKIYVFYHPFIIPSHIGSEGIVNFVLSLPIEKREEMSAKLIQTEDIAYVLKTVDNYNISLYKNILKYINDERVIKNYISGLNEAFGLQLKTKEQITTYCQLKITELNKLKNNSNKIKKMVDTISMNFKVNGTPTIIDIKGKNLNDYFTPFYKNNITDLSAIKEYANSEFKILAGKGTKEAFLFLSTQDKKSKEFFAGEKMKKLLENYKVTIIPTATGSNPQKALKEAQFIFNLKDNNKRFKVFEALMSGKELSFEELNMSHEQNFSQKSQYFLFRKMRDTLVQKTPLFIENN